MNAKEISKYLGCTKQAIYNMARIHEWDKTGESYHVTTADLDAIRNNPSKRGRKFGSKVLHQVKSEHSKEVFDASALVAIW